MTFRSDPNVPGSDAWAGLDEASVRTWNSGMSWLREQMVAIRRFTAATRTFGWNERNRPAHWVDCQVERRRA